MTNFTLISSKEATWGNDFTDEEGDALVTYMDEFCNLETVHDCFDSDQEWSYDLITVCYWRWQTLSGEVETLLDLSGKLSGAEQGCICLNGEYIVEIIDGSLEPRDNCPKELIPFLDELSSLRNKEKVEC